MGQSIRLEGRSWQISGIFSAGGSAFESEIWCRLDGLQQAMKRQDLSLVVVTLAPEGDFAEPRSVLQREARSGIADDAGDGLLYESLPKRLWPRSQTWHGWSCCCLPVRRYFCRHEHDVRIGRGADLGTRHTADHRLCPPGGRREPDPGGFVAFGCRQFARGGTRALVFVNGVAVRFTMGAFALRVDSMAILIGCGVSLLLGFLGALYPAVRALRMPIVEGLKTV